MPENVWLRRIIAEYREMPGMQLSASQAARLWGLDDTTCLTLLHELVERGALACTEDGRFRLAGDGEQASSGRPRRRGVEGDQARHSRGPGRLRRPSATEV